MLILVMYYQRGVILCSCCFEMVSVFVLCNNMLGIRSCVTLDVHLTRIRFHTRHDSRYQASIPACKHRHTLMIHTYWHKDMVVISSKWIPLSFFAKSVGIVAILTNTIVMLHNKINIVLTMLLSIDHNVKPSRVASSIIMVVCVCIHWSGDNVLSIVRSTLLISNCSFFSNNISDQAVLNSLL